MDGTGPSSYMFKTISIFLCLVQQHARPLSAVIVDLVPLVQGGRCRGEHDEKLFHQA